MLEPDAESKSVWMGYLWVGGRGGSKHGAKENRAHTRTHQLRRAKFYLNELFLWLGWRVVVLHGEVEIKFESQCVWLFWHVVTFRLSAAPTDYNNSIKTLAPADIPCYLWSAGGDSPTGTLWVSGELSRKMKSGFLVYFSQALVQVVCSFKPLFEG